MNRALIIAELRRSAIEDQRPWVMCTQSAWNAACDVLDWNERLREHTNEDVAMFFLIVAESMEQEDGN
jgi:hypothetical protein